VAGATHSVVRFTSTRPTSSQTSSPPTSASDQYAVDPTITDFSPGQGAPGYSVTVDGANFTGPSAITEVDLAGEPTSYQVTSSTSLVFTVPSDALSGTITVKNAKGSATSTGTFTVLATPAITGVSPGDAAAGTDVTITGSGFTGVDKVTFNNVAADFTGSDTTIHATVPAKAPAKAGQIVVHNAAGTATATFTVDSGAPVVTSFSPTSAAPAFDPVKIMGKNFKNTAQVLFNGTAATIDSVNTAGTEVDVQVPAGATSGPITVVNDVGSGASSKDFLVLGGPAISDFTPGYGKVLSPVTVHGSSFTGATDVKFGSADAGKPTVKDDGTILTKVPKTAVGDVKIEIDTPRGNVTSTDSFTVVADAPNPTSASPASGGAGTVVTITGDTLTGVSKVAVNGKAASFTAVDDGTVKAVVPVGAPVGGGKGASAGIVVTNVAGKTGQVAFTVLDTAPTVTRVTDDGTKPKTITSAREGDTIHIVGTNLDRPGTSVDFGGTSTSTFAHRSATDLELAVPAGASTGALTVANDSGSGVLKGTFTILKQPVVLGFSPAYGKVGAKVKIVGDNFTGVTSVDFNGISTRGTLNKDGSISTAVPAKATTGPITVHVGTLAGDSGNDSFTVEQAPKLDDSPFSVSEAVAGQTVHITGGNLIGVTKVKFGIVYSTFVHVDSATQVTATVPAGATSGKVAVTNDAGTATSKAALPITAIVGFSPASGPVGTKVTIVGTHLTGATVKFHGTSAAPSDYVSQSDTKLVVKVPTGATSGAVTVSTSAGTASGPKSFTVITTARIDSFPASARPGTRITVTGDGFVQVRSVTIGGLAASFSVRSATELWVTVPARATSGRLAITNVAGTTTSTGTLSVIR
jgi:hypothetical protein